MKLEFLEDGAEECPLVRLYGDEPDVIANIVRALAWLGSDPLGLDALPGIEPVDGCRLLARSGSRDQGARSLGESVFEWVMSKEGWAEVCDLLRPFGERTGAPRFQYLSRSGPVTLIISTDGRW